MMNKMQEQVLEFHRFYKVDAPNKPDIPNIKKILEEQENVDEG